MAASILDILVRVQDKSLKDLDKNLKGVGDTAQKTEKQGNSFAKTLGGIGKTAGLAAGAAGLGALTVGLKIGIGEYMQAQKVGAQTNAVLKSTGGAANVSAKQIGDLATALMKKSGMDDEAIQSGENLLLTFTNIRNEAGKGNDIFNQTTRIMTDMSVSLGQDTKTSAIQLGKALNDPIKGVTALQRVGVSFTASQKEQIKALVDSGHTMEAQKLILGELNKEFGGSAEAAGKTLPGQISILKESFNNFAGDLVAKSIPILQQTIAWLRDHWPEIQAAVQNFWNSVQPLLNAFFDLLKTAFPIVKKAIEEFLPVLKDIATIFQGVVETITALMHGDWSKAWDGIKKIVTGTLGGIKDALVGTVTVWWTAFHGVFDKLFVDPFKEAWNGITNWLKDHWLEAVLILFTGFPGLIYTAIHEGWDDKLFGPLKTLFGGIGTFLKNKITDFADFFKSLPEKIGKAALDGAAGATHFIVSMIDKLFGKLGKWVRGILGINSPSKEFQEIGNYIVQGLVKGLEEGGFGIKDAIMKIINDYLKKPFEEIANDFKDWTEDMWDDLGKLGGIITGGGGLHLKKGPYEGMPGYHATAGLAGYGAIDQFASGGTVVYPPEAGKVSRLSGRPFSEGWSNGPGSAIGLSMYLMTKAGEYFLTHFDKLFRSVGDTVLPFMPIGTVGPMDAYGVSAHIHTGYHAFARGGIVTKPTLGLVGEAGPEAIIPLDKGGIGNINVYVTGNVVTEHELVDAIYQGLLKKGRRNPLALPA